VLELLHGDLCGPILPQTPGGNRYFLLLVDDYSRYMWLVVLASKDKVFEGFKNLKVSLEVEQGKKLKGLRTDRGGEFRSSLFENYCKEHGIKRHLTAPYSPQQNGVVERRNQTIVAMARSMLKAKKVPSEFWGEAVTTAVYILNRSPTKSVEKQTPYEAWHKRKPTVHHMRVFGCLAHVKSVGRHLRKLDDRSTKMVFFGYEKGSKAYRVYNSITRKIEVTRDVVFEEDKEGPWLTGKDHSSKGQETTTFKLPTDLHTARESVKQGENDQNSEAAEGGDTDEGDTMPLENQTPVVYDQEEDDSPHQTPVRMRSLADIYDETEALNFMGVCMLGIEEPNSFEEAMKEKEWKQAMMEEIESINSNKTWSLVDLAKGKKVIGLKWVYKLKKDSEGRVVKHKARLVAKGYVQKQGVDYEEIFAPVARMETVRLIIAVAVQEGWLLHHMDVRSAFLNGELQEEVYVAQPPGFEVQGTKDKVLRLHKALYGLKQAPRAWNFKLDKTLNSLGFKRSDSEHAVYKRGQGVTCIIVGIYVDDLIITGANEMEIENFKDQMKRTFRMSDLGLLSYYLGIEVKQLKNMVLLSQESFALKVLRECGMDECNPAKAPMETRLKLRRESTSELVDAGKYRSIVGSLRYLLHTRPDLAYSVGIVSRFMEAPRREHMAAVKHILRYIQGTLSLGCQYMKTDKGTASLVGYSDSDLAGDLNDRRSTTGVIEISQTLMEG
jgi:Reverse transcriptase (RNA-dependent DNA polymerase)/Integrase core domain